MPNIDERIVQMSFDNAQFESGVSKSMNTLEKLKNALNFDGATKGFEKLEQSSKDVDFSHLESSVDSIANKFTLLGQIGLKAMDKIATSVVNAGEKMVKSISVDQISAGMSKYETKTKAVQTIMNATGKSIDEVNEVLTTLMKYTDETSYDFSTMAATIGKFTSAGVDLEVAEKAMEGIANEAALSGAGIQEANRAMYNFAQSLSAGSVMVRDWMSIENANMATKEFKEELIKTAIAMGTLNTENGETGVIMKQTKKATKKTAAEFRKTEVNYQTFRETLKEGWLTSEVLINTLARYTKGTGDLGDRAFEAAQKALTFTDAMNAIKDAVSSGWMVSFELLFGNLEESINLWTGFCEAIIDALKRISDWRNELLQVWHDGADGVSGYQMAIESVKNVWETFIGVIDAVSDAFAEIIPPMVGEDLLNITKSIYNATENLKEFLKYIPGVEVEEKVFDTTNLISGLNDSTLVLGDMSSQVGILNKALVEMGYLEKSSVESFWDGYSKDTEKAVKKLQKKLGLEQTGIWDAATKEAAEADGIFEKIVQKKNMIEGLDKDLKLGDANKEVKRLQNAIIAAGGAAEGFVADGIYGEKTQEEIKRIQKDLGVEVTGIWDEATRNAANEQKKFEKIVNTNKIAGLDKDLKAGDANKDVEKLQKALIATGKTSEGFVADGIFGAKTQTEIKKLQKELGVTETGIWDEATRNAAEADGRFNKIEGHMEKVMKYAGETYKTTKYFEHTIDHSQEIELMPEVEKADKDNVKKLQEQLYNAGFTSVGVADGIYGPKTQKAVKQLQAKLGVAQTGIWDKTTRDAAAAQGMFAEIVGETKEVEEVVESSSRAIYALQSVTMAFGSVLGFLSNVWGVVTGAAKHMLEILSPLGNAFLLVVTYVGDLITNTEAEISQSGAFEIALATINAALDTLAPIVNTVATAIENFIKLLYENDVNSLTELFPFLGKIIGDWFKTLREQYPIIDIVISAIESFRDSITGFFEKVTGFKWKKKLPFVTNIQNAFKSVQRTVNKYIDKIKKRFKGNMFSDDPIQKFIGELQYAWALVKTIWNPDKSFKENLKKVSKAIGLWIEDIRKQFPALDFILKIKDAVVSVYDTIKGFSFNDEGKFVLFDNIKAKIDEIKTKIGTFFDNLRREYPIIDKIFKAFEWIKEKWDGIISSLTWDSEKTFGENITANVEIIKTKLIEAFNEIKGKWDNFVKENPILSFIGGVLKSIKDFSFDKNGKFVLFDNIKAKIDEAKTAIDNFFNGLRTKYPVIDKILSAFEWLKEKFDDIKASLNWDPEKSFGENIGAAFDLIKQKVGAAFDEIKTKIDNFLKENPQLVKAIETFNTIKDAITNFFTVDTSDEETTTGKLQKRLEQLQPIIDGIVKFVQSDTFKGILITLGAALLVALAATLVNVGPIIWTALQTGIASLAQNNPLIGSFATKIFNPFAAFVGGLFASLFAGTNSFGWDSEKSFGQNIEDNLNVLKENITIILDNIRAKIEEFINSPQVQGFIAKVRPIIDFLIETFNAIKDAFVNFFTADTSGEENPFDKLLVRLKSAAKPLIDWFLMIKEKIVTLWNAIFHPETNDGAEKKGSKSSLLTILGNIIKNFKNTLLSGKTMGFGIGILLAALGLTLYKIADAIDELVLRYYVAKSKMKKDTLGDTFLKIAGAIALIAIAVGALALVEKNGGDIDKAFGYISATIGVISGMVLLLTWLMGNIVQGKGKDFKKAGEGIKSMVTALIMIILSVVGVALLIGMGIADKKFGGQLLASLFIVGGIIAALGFFSIWLAKNGAKISNGGKGINPVLQMCAGVLVLAWAIESLSTTLSTHGYLDVAIALTMILAVLGVLAFIVYKIAQVDKEKVAVKGVLKMCLGVLVLSWALGNVAKTLDSYSNWDVFLGMSWLMGMLIALGAIAYFIAKVSKDGFKGPQGILKMCLGILVVAYALDMVTKTLNTNRTNALLGMGFIVVTILVIYSVIKGLADIVNDKKGKGVKSLAAAVGAMVTVLAVVAGLILVVTKSIKDVKDVDWKVITALLGGIVAIVLVVGLMTALAAKVGGGAMFKGGLGLAGALVVVGAALGIVAKIGLGVARQASAVLERIGTGVSNFCKKTEGVKPSRLKIICSVIKDNVVPMMKGVAGSGITYSDKSFSSILTRIGMAIGSFATDTKDADPEKIKSLKSIPRTVKYICDKLGEITNADKRTILDDVGASLAQFFDLTKNVNNDKSEVLKGIAQTAKDIADIALMIGDAQTIVDKLVSVGSALYSYEFLTKDLTPPSEDDPGMKIAKNAKEVASIIMEIGDSQSIVDKLVSMGGALSLYSSLMRGVEDSEGRYATLENVSDEDVGMVLAKSITGIYNSLKEMKADEFKVIESNIVLLGGALRLYYKSLGDIETVTEEGEEIDIDPSTVTKVLNTMAEALPDADLFKKSFEQVKALAPETEDGVDNLALFSAGVSALGVAIGDYADNVGKLKDKESEISSANSILQAASSIWKNFEDDQVGNVIPSDAAIANGKSFGTVDSETAGSRNMSSFSAGIEALGKAISDYATNIGGLKNKKHLIDLANGIIDKAADIWTNFADTSKIPSEDVANNVGALRETGGSVSLNNFTAGIGALGKAIGEYATEIGTKLDGKEEQITLANKIIDKAAYIWRRFNGTGKIPTGKAVDNVKGLNGMNGANGVTGFAGGIRQLGVAIGSYATNLKDIDPDDIDAGNKVLDKVASIKEALDRNKGATEQINQSVLGFISTTVTTTPSETDLVNFSEDIKALGRAAGEYASAVVGISGYTSDIEQANTILDAIAGLQERIPKVGGIADWFEGSSDLVDFAQGMDGLGTAVADFVDELVQGNFPTNISQLTSDDKLKALRSVVMIVADLAVKLPKTGAIHDFLTGVTDLKEFASKLDGLGEGICGFIQELVDGQFSEKMDNFDDDDMEKFGKLADFLTALSTIAQISQNFSYLVSTSDLGQDIVNFLNSLALIDLDMVDWAAIDEFYATVQEHLANGIPKGSGSEEASDIVSDAFALLFAGVKTNASNTANDKDFWEGISGTICEHLSNGIAFNNTETGENSPYRSFKAMLLKLKGYANILKFNGTWTSIGRDVDLGLAQGIRNYQVDVEQAGTDLMTALKNAAREAIDSDSPSKDFMDVGTDIDDGLIIGLQKYSDRVAGAGGELTEGALGAAEGGLSAISNLLSDDIDANPTIRPVLDLSEVHAQAGLINGYLGNRTLGLRVNASANTANHISASEERNQNSRNSTDTSLNNTIRSLNEQVENLGNKITNLKVVMNSGALVGQIVNDMDRALGRRSILGGRLN